MKTRIKLDLDFGICNGSMTVDIFQDNVLLTTLENITDNSKTVCLDVVFPCQLKFVLSGKNYNLDTMVDSDGSVIKDKCVILKSMQIESILVKIDVLFDICQYYKDHKEPPIADTYWGFNGHVVIDFDADNFIAWCLKHNNIFDF